MTDGVTVIWDPAVESDSHATLSEAVHASAPAPTVIVFAAGDAPPATAENDRLEGVSVRVGGGGSTVSVTGIALGDPTAPGAVTVISVVYAPGARPDVSGVTVSVSPSRDSDSQPTLSDALQPRPRPP